VQYATEYTKENGKKKENMSAFHLMIRVNTIILSLNNKLNE